MDLPTMITSTFDKVTTGILSPLVSGFGHVIPFLIILAIIVSFCLLLFSNRKGPAGVTLFICLVILVIYGNIDGWFSAFFSWFGADNVAQSDAFKDMANGIDTGAADSLGTLKDQQ